MKSVSNHRWFGGKSTFSQDEDDELLAVIKDMADDYLPKFDMRALCAGFGVDRPRALSVDSMKEELANSDAKKQQGGQPGTPYLVFEDMRARGLDDPLFSCERNQKNLRLLTSGERCWAW
jgi:hypothetical protein